MIAKCVLDGAKNDTLHS